MTDQYQLNMHAAVFPPDTNLSVKSPLVLNDSTIVNPSYPDAGDFQTTPFTLKGNIKEVFGKAVKNIAAPLLVAELGSDYNEETYNEGLKSLVQSLN